MEGLLSENDLGLVLPTRPKTILDYLTLEVFDRSVRDMNFDESVSFEEWADDASEVLKLDRRLAVSAQMKKERVSRSEKKKEIEASEYIRESLSQRFDRNESVEPGSQGRCDFCRHPVYNRKQEQRMRMLFPILTGFNSQEFSIAKMRGAFVKFSRIMFNLGWFKAPRNLLTFATLIDRVIKQAYFIPRINNDYSYCLKGQGENTSNSLSYWIRDLKLFVKVFGGDRYSTSLLAGVSECYNKTLRTYQISRGEQPVYAQMKGFMRRAIDESVADVVKEASPGIMNVFGEEVKRYVTSFILDWPKHIGDVIEGIVKGLDCEFVTKIYDFLHDVYLKIRGWVEKWWKMVGYTNSMLVDIICVLVICAFATLLWKSFSICAELMKLGLAMFFQRVFHIKMRRSLDDSIDALFQSEIIDAQFLGATTSLCAIASVVVAVLDVKSVSKFSSVMTIVGRGLPISDTIISDFKGIVDHLYFYITNDHLFPEIKTVEAFNARMKKMEDFVSTPDLKEKVMREPAFTKELAALVEDSWHYKEVLRNSQSPLLGHYSRVYQQLFELNAEALASADMYKARIETVVLWLMGKPKQGKSLLMDILSEAVYLELQEHYGLREYPPWTPAQMYERTKGSDYWEGYWGQWGCKKNEVLAVKAAEEKAKEVLEILNIAEESVFPLNMAFKEKGKAFFRSELFVATTNYALTDRTTSQLGIENPNALLRRRTFPITVIRQAELQPNYSNVDKAWSLRVLYPERNSEESYFDGLSKHLGLHDEQRRLNFKKAGFVDFTFSEIVRAMTLEIRDRKDKPKTLIEFGKHYKPRVFKIPKVQPDVLSGSEGDIIIVDPIDKDYKIVIRDNESESSEIGMDETISFSDKPEAQMFKSIMSILQEDLDPDHDPIVLTASGNEVYGIDSVMNDRMNIDDRAMALHDLESTMAYDLTGKYSLMFRIEELLLRCGFDDMKKMFSDIRICRHWHENRLRSDSTNALPPCLRSSHLKAWKELMHEGTPLEAMAMNIRNFNLSLMEMEVFRTYGGYTFSKITSLIYFFLAWYALHYRCTLAPDRGSDNFTDLFGMKGKSYDPLRKTMYKEQSLMIRYRVSEKWETIVDRFWDSYNTFYDWVCERPVFDYVLFGTIVVGAMAVMLVPHFWSASKQSVLTASEYVESQMLSKEINPQSYTKGRFETVPSRSVHAESITKGNHETVANRRITANSAAEHIKSRFDKASANIVAVRLTYSHIQVDCLVFFVYGTVCVITSHNFRSMGDDFITLSILDRFGGKITNSFDRSSIHLRYLDDATHSRGSRDFCVLTINPALCSSFKDIRKHLPMGDRECPTDGVVRLKLFHSKEKTTQFVVTGKDFITYSLSHRKDIENTYDRKKKLFVPVTNYVIGHNMRGEPGDCMLPYISTFELDSRVYLEGFHVGSTGTDAFFCPLYQEDFEERFDFSTGSYILSSDAQMPIGWYAPKELKISFNSSGAEHLDGARYLGELAKSFYLPSETVFVPTVFQGDINSEPVFPVKNAPALLKPTYVNEVLKEPFKRGKAKLGAVDKSTPIPGWLAREAVLNYRMFSDGFAPPENVHRPRFEEQSIEEAIFGIPGKQASIDLNTSEGFCLKILKMKRKDAINLDTRFIHPKIREMVENLRNAVRKGKVPRLIAIACMKDELRDIPRVEEGKTRIFCVGDFIHMIWTRMVLGNLIIWLKEHRAQTMGAIGTNVHGFDWSVLMAKISGKGVNYGGGDYGGYDTGLRYFFGFLLGLFCCGEMGLDWKTDGREVLYCCLSSTCPLLVVGRYVYDFDFMNPSGGFLTGFLNTFVNICLFHIFFYKLRVECKESGCECGFSVAVFNDIVKAIFYGDDNIFSTVPGIGDHFNMINISRLCKDMFGMEYTTASKGVVESPFIQKEEVEFLMRRFVQKGNFTLAPLDKDSIYSMILWIRDKKSEVENQDQLQQNIDTSQMEMFYYGREQFNFYTNQLRNYSRTRNVNFEFRTYEFYQARHIAAYGS